MTHALIVLRLPEETRNRYRDDLRAAFPDITVEAVNTVDEIKDPSKVDILMTFGTMTTDALFAEATQLKWVHALGTGVDGIADRPTLRPDVLVTNTHGIHGPPVSEATISLMLAMARYMPQFVHQQDRHEWRRWQVSLLYRKTVGILGVGAIAEALAPRLKALGMRVVGISGTPRDVPGFDEMRPRQPLSAAVADLDYFVLLIPYDQRSHHIVDAAVLAAMKPSAYLINVARGGVVDEQALLDALARKQIAGAALDVFSEEPLPPESPLWDADGVFITSHNAGFCDVYADMALEIILPNMRAYLDGRLDKMTNKVRHPG